MNAKKTFNINEISDFVDLEVGREDFGIRRIVEGIPEEQLVQRNVLGPLRPVEYEDNLVTLQGKNIYFSRFRAGDTVDVAIIDSQTKRFRSLFTAGISSVSFTDPGSIDVKIRREVVHDLPSVVFLIPKTAMSQV